MLRSINTNSLQLFPLTALHRPLPRICCGCHTSSPFFLFVLVSRHRLLRLRQWSSPETPLKKKTIPLSADYLLHGTVLMASGCSCARFFLRHSWMGARTWTATRPSYSAASETEARERFCTKCAIYDDDHGSHLVLFKKITT